MPFINQKDILKWRMTNWSDTIANMSSEQACTDLMSTVKDILLEYTKIRGKKQNKQTKKGKTKFTLV